MGMFSMFNDTDLHNLIQELTGYLRALRVKAQAEAYAAMRTNSGGLLSTGPAADAILSKISKL